MSIHILPSQISDQIAAGEVVERPASVVKELIENALDAEATHIEVRIEKGGTSLIEIRDDGSGMSREDATKCILRHATSKIQKIEDLFQIQSFGFRGEALAAIAAVSRLELITKTNQAKTGTRVQVIGGKKPDISETAANDGTIIRIKDLFFTTPARRAYLRTEETESRAILREIQHFALSHHEKSFILFQDEKQKAHFPSTKTLQDRIQQVLKIGSETLVSISGRANNARISGFVSTSGHCLASRRSQFLFVNGRAIEDRSIAFAVREAYVQSAGIEKHLHPAFVLFLEIDPILVDVNVHPRKLEVKFSEPAEIFSLVKKSVTSSLSKASTPSYSPQTMYTGSIQKSSGRPAVSEFSKFNFQERNQTRQHTVPTPPSSFPEIDSDAPMKLIGQIANRYIAAESDDGMYLFDQHALHERQRFEQFWNEWKTSKQKIQKLLTPVSLKFPEEVISLLYEHRSILTHLGFAVTFSQDDTLTLSEVPQIFVKEELKSVFENLITYLQNEQIGESASDILMRKLIEYKSCRGAVKFGDKLHASEMQKLLEDFATTGWRNLCPHGRPNHIFLPFQTLNQEFHR